MYHLETILSTALLGGAKVHGMSEATFLNAKTGDVIAGLEIEYLDRKLTNDDTIGFDDNEQKYHEWRESDHTVILKLDHAKESNATNKCDCVNYYTSAHYKAMGRKRFRCNSKDNKCWDGSKKGVLWGRVKRDGMYIASTRRVEGG